MRGAGGQEGDRQIYVALLRDLFRGSLPASYVIQTMPLSLPQPSAYDWRWLGSGTAALQAKVEATKPLPAVAFSAGSFLDPTTLVSKEELVAFFHDGPAGTSLNDRWRAFHERFKVEAFQAFSRPVVTDAGLDALVYYSNSYGSQGGEAGFAWLHRSSPSAAWAVEKRLPKVSA